MKIKSFSVELINISTQVLYETTKDDFAEIQKLLSSAT